MASIEQLQNFRNYLQGVHEFQTSRDDDLLAVVVGSEGVGKSTLMLQATAIWERIRGRDPTPGDVLDRVVWGERDAFKETLLDSQEGDVITVQDAAHVLYSKESMHGEQIEIEKALLDTRINNYLMLLGFQDWGDIPSNLRRRRAQHCIRVYKNEHNERGFFEIYGREQLDEKYNQTDRNWWPEPAMQDRFPSLEGTELWRQFRRRDNEEKEGRLRDAQEIEEADARKQEQIKVALRAVQPWSEEEGMTQTAAAKIIDYSPSWISRRVSEWEDGAYRDLVQEDDVVHRVTAEVDE